VSGAECYDSAGLATWSDAISIVAGRDAHDGMILVTIMLVARRSLLG
jgi:hypothetical protein